MKELPIVWDVSPAITYLRHAADILEVEVKAVDSGVVQIKELITALKLAASHAGHGLGHIRSQLERLDMESPR